MFEKGLLKGKRVLITGGGSGLGAAMGRRFAELGAALIICGRRLELLEQTASDMRNDFGVTVHVVRCDIRDGGAVDAMMVQLFGEAPIDVLVNNAAATFLAQTEHLSFRAADAILGPTLHGTMYCTLAAGKRWIERKHGGVVLSILSTSTITGRAFTVPSAMAKSAILAMTKSLAVEWGPKVRLNCVSGGLIATEQADLFYGDSDAQARVAATVPAARLGVPADIAAACVFLASPEASYISGANIVVHGGGERPAFLSAVE